MGQGDEVKMCRGKSGGCGKKWRGKSGVQGKNDEKGTGLFRAWQSPKLLISNQILHFFTLLSQILLNFDLSHD
jgi:hypothetical protein